MQATEFFQDKVPVHKNALIIALWFFMIGLLLMAFASARHGIGDFGNYYYGSKFFLSGTDPLKLYKDLHFFNTQIRNFESAPFFENYAPVPPFSLIFYMPFTLFDCGTAKLCFNLFGLLFLSFSLYRSMRFLNFTHTSLYMLPFIFFQPLYSNLLQGQTYLLVSALLLEFCMALQNDKKWHCAVIVACLFSLKIFPAFVAVVFVVKRDWSGLARVLAGIAILQMFTFLIVGAETFGYYWLEVFPRLARNEIIEPFGYFNQSAHVFLLKTFVFHPYLNTKPFFNSPTTALLLQAVFYALAAGALIRIILNKKAHTSLFFVILAMLLTTAYSTVYALLLLIPFVFLVKEIPVRKMILPMVMLTLACSIPVHRLQGMPVAMQFLRLWLLLFIFYLLAKELKAGFSLKLFIPLFIIFIPFSINFLSVDLQERTNLEEQQVLYDFTAGPEGIKLFACLGSRDTVLSCPLKVNSSDSLVVLDNGSGVMSDYKVLYKSTGHIAKCLLINENTLLVLTDECRGPGMYRLISKTIR